MNDLSMNHEAAGYPHRKQNRLRHMRYNENGAYFVTICTRNRANVFWSMGSDSREPEVGAALRRPPEALSVNGRIVQREIDRFDAIYQGVVTVDHAVIMPNHVHMLLSIHQEQTGGRRNAAPTISSVINQFKGMTTKLIGFPCWQKSFYDHIVRDEQEYQKIWSYIDANPGKWAEDKYFIETDG